MQLPTGGILDIFGISTQCEFGPCIDIPQSLKPGDVAYAAAPIDYSPWIFYIFGWAHDAINNTNNDQLRKARKYEQAYNTCNKQALSVSGPPIPDTKIGWAKLALSAALSYLLPGGGVGTKVARAVAIGNGSSMIVAGEVYNFNFGGCMAANGVPTMVGIPMDN